MRTGVRSSPYWPVVSHPQLGRVLPGLMVSALGDGMSLVAVTWLALQLAPDAHRGTWVAVAVAAYSLPSAAGGVLFGRFLRGRRGAQLAGWNALLRAGGLGAIAVTHALGGLSLGVYVTLLAVSSLLATWGSAGHYTLIAELLPPVHHLPANAVMTTIGNVATVAGPPLAGLLIGWTSPATVIAVDAASFAVLALTYRLAVPAVVPAGVPVGVPVGAATAPSPATPGFAAIRADRTLLGLLGLSFAFFFLFGPFYVAMPVHVAGDLHASATVLGVFYTAFGAGAMLGGLAAGYLSRWSLWPTTTGIVVAFGVAMLPLGLGVPAPLAAASFALAGAIWAPYMATSMALFQRGTPAADLPAVLAANGSVLVLAVPLGTMLGGPLVGTLGARRTLLACAAATVALGVLAAVVRFCHTSVVGSGRGDGGGAARR
ncbi:MFS transporter [Dactylosporangium aurantiacum]|uniref:MFS transporter n=1 Tax=Dactylosporangium aurantiacum TaxID=35754 RepID=A0A9Q9MDH3_9ACTN|nr:MFS transporter [Dactylosporangium aurantiacum]MDG6108030.1 MFS transporter [Dactylosporangium aurantiacum]UWZ50260.1 MFS transporter [Dactylosporangium aurantiacum]